MVVFVLKPDAGPFSLNRQAAIVGFTARGAEIRLFEAEAFDTLALTKDDILVGGVGFAHRAFEKLGIETPCLESVPTQLSAFAGRRTWRGPIIDARRAVERGEAVFVKPLPTALKSFTGQPMRSFSDLITTSHIPDDTIVDCAELTPFLSEYRVFVLHGAIVGVRHYKGDPLLFPDGDRVRAAVTAYADAPASYALDVGVAEDGRTLLVEVNDSYATGDYGLAPVRFAAVIEARWNELKEAP